MIIKFITDKKHSVSVTSSNIDFYDYQIGFKFSLNVSYDESKKYNYAQEVVQCEVDEIYWEDDNTKVYSCMVK